MTNHDSGELLGRRAAAGFIDLLVGVVLLFAVGLIFGETRCWHGGGVVTLGPTGTVIVIALLGICYSLRNC